MLMPKRVKRRRQIGVKVWIYKGEVLGGVPREEVTTNVNA